MSLENSYFREMLSFLLSGDSYTETGFLTNGNLPAVGNPLGNPPYPGYTATGVDVLSADIPVL